MFLLSLSMQQLFYFSFLLLCPLLLRSQPLVQPLPFGQAQGHQCGPGPPTVGKGSYAAALAVQALKWEGSANKPLRGDKTKLKILNLLFITKLPLLQSLPASVHLKWTLRPDAAGTTAEGAPTLSACCTAS